MAMIRQGLARSSLMTLAVIIVAAGCSPREDVRGSIIDPDKLAQVAVGTTTQEQLFRLLGSPSAKSTFSERADTWYYISTRTETVAFLSPVTTDRKVVAIDFSRATGRVSDVRSFGMEDARDVEPVDRVTPTKGREMTVLQQLFGNIGRFNDRSTGRAGR
jgi:outer membrane protein assembly factor BamE (lipoprotein component of BamABCDE complex)